MAHEFKPERLQKEYLKPLDLGPEVLTAIAVNKDTFEISVVLIKDSKPQFEFKIPFDKLKQAFQNQGILNPCKMLKLKLIHQLKKRESDEYLAFRASKKNPGNDGHHIIGKRNDYLICEMSHKLHMENPNVDFDDQLINALENLFDYVQFLEESHDNVSRKGPDQGFNEDF